MDKIDESKIIHRDIDDSRKAFIDELLRIVKEELTIKINNFKRLNSYDYTKRKNLVWMGAIF
mgnify:FL=1|jgi:hypothetical protein